MILGYARVSKGEVQDTRMQETALRTAGVERLFTEQASGGRWDRPHLHRLLDQLCPEDVVIVLKLAGGMDAVRILVPYEDGDQVYRPYTDEWVGRQISSLSDVFDVLANSARG
jgi:hypothetical protein